MSDDPFHDNPPPRGLLWAGASLALLTLAVATVVSTTGVGRLATPEAAAIHSVALRFEDRARGGVAVLAADTGSEIAALAPGTNNFVRHVMRGLARERRQHGIGAIPPFRLTQWSDGRLTLEDTATGRRIPLEAFGPDNAGAFARFISLHPSSNKQQAAIQ